MLGDPASAELAEQSQSWGTTFGPEFRHSDPLTGAWVEAGQRREPDSLGSDAGEFNPYFTSASPFDALDPSGTGLFKQMGDLTDLRGGCVLDSMPVPCSFAVGEVNSGAALINTRHLQLW